jgi:hypothetical protein
MPTETVSMKDWMRFGWTIKSADIDSLKEFAIVSNEDAEDLADALATKRKYETYGAEVFSQRETT